MAASKRVRYEVLRRDNFTCRYCGAKAPAAELTVDHVIPQALGGTDDPTNLVAACVDCNSGKTSTMPSDDTVAEASEDAMRWRQAISEAAATMTAEQDAQRQIFEYIESEWAYRYEEPLGPMPDDWRSSVVTFQSLGLPVAVMDEAIEIAARARISDSRRWRYFCGICWNKLRELQEHAARIVGGPKDVRP